VVAKDGFEYTFIHILYWFSICKSIEFSAITALFYIKIMLIIALFYIFRTTSIALFYKKLSAYTLLYTQVNNNERAIHSVGTVP
jgi:hypothetical protein